MRWLLPAFLITTACGVALAARVTTAETEPGGHWRQLAQPHAIAGGAGALYYSFDLANGSRAHLIVCAINKGWRLQPAINEPGDAPTSVQARAADAEAAVNAGYFNLKDGGHSTSYITIDGRQVADPTTNQALMGNPKLKPFIARILNRSEVRFMRDPSGKTAVQITRHNTPLAGGMTLTDAVQAGPQLLPTVTAIDEAFIRTNPDGSDTDAISARKAAARTAFGITSDGYALMLCVSGKGQEPESSGITLEDLAALMRRLGCVQAINFDGGASTTMWVRLQEENGQDRTGRVVCGKQPETLVKSVLLLKGGT